MQRAAVLIGVKKTGNLPELQAVHSSVEDMHKWTVAQRFDPELVKVITDAQGPVTASQIKAEIKKLVGLTTIEQLIVYFSGHGFNIESEFWLLSDAPSDTEAAINVEGSVRLARYCGIPHVVLVSDCCRSAAEGLQAMQVRGSNAFPNDPASGTGKPVDVLFSCARGRPSLEIRDPAAAVAEAVNGYSAIYSEVLLEHLNGEYPEALERVREDGQDIGLLKLGKLADRLKAEVPARIKRKRGVDPKLTQQPDDLISRATGDAWISRVTSIVTRGQAPVTPVSRGMAVTPLALSDRLVASSLAGDAPQWNDLLDRDLGEETRDLQSAVKSQAAPFGPPHFETQCGFKIRGARIARTVQRDVRSEFLGSDGNLIRLNGVPRLGANVLLVLENGCGAVIPAIPEFIAALTFDGGQLMDVSYEPSDNSGRWGEYQRKAGELRSLRASIAASAALGKFRVDERGGLELARRMQFSKGVDPSLALYAAYAYDSLQRRDLVDQMRDYMIGDLGLILFDVALQSSWPKLGRILGSFPLLSQGWALLSAYRAELPDALGDIAQLRLPSLWTLFNPAGVRLLERAISTGGIQ